MAKTKGLEPQGRVFKDKFSFVHDLFRLKTATMTKNMAWSKKMAAIWEPFQHKHFFHSYDSDGRAQTRSTSALGHFHECEMIEVNGTPTLKVGPAKKEVIEIFEGLPRKVAVVLEGREGHTHEGEYVTSENLQTRRLNNEAIKLQDHLASKANPALEGEEKKSIRDVAREGHQD
jgi:hypothetical protein